MKRIIKNVTPFRTYFTLQHRFFYIFWAYERNAKDQIMEFDLVEDVQSYIENNKKYYKEVVKTIQTR